MSDREFLIWLHERLEHVHGESPFISYMHTLRVLIRATPKDQNTPRRDSKNSLDDMLKTLED